MVPTRSAGDAYRCRDGRGRRGKSIGEPSRAERKKRWTKIDARIRTAVTAGVAEGPRRTAWPRKLHYGRKHLIDALRDRCGCIRAEATAFVAEFLVVIREFLNDLGQAVRIGEDGFTSRCGVTRQLFGCPATGGLQLRRLALRPSLRSMSHKGRGDNKHQRSHSGHFKPPIQGLDLCSLGFQST